MIKPCDLKCSSRLQWLLQVPNALNDEPSDHSPMSSQVLSIQKIAEIVNVPLKQSLVLS